MAPPLYILTAVDVRRAEQAGSSRVNTIAQLTVPAIRFVTADPNPGGGVMGGAYALPRIQAPEGSASIVAKPVMGGRQRKENTGEGEEDITIEGPVLPFRIGGLSEIEILHEMRRSGARFPLMRGDGYRFGWYAINRLREGHRHLMRDGVGFVVTYSISMEQVQFDAGGGQQVVSSILSIFDALGG